MQVPLVQNGPGLVQNAGRRRGRPVPGMRRFGTIRPPFGTKRAPRRLRRRNWRRTAFTISCGAGICRAARLLGWLALALRSCGWVGRPETAPCAVGPASRLLLARHSVGMAVRLVLASDATWSVARLGSARCSVRWSRGWRWCEAFGHGCAAGSGVGCDASVAQLRIARCSVRWSPGWRWREAFGHGWAAGSGVRCDVVGCTTGFSAARCGLVAGVAVV